MAATASIMRVVYCIAYGISCSVQFSSFCFDNPGNAASPIDRRFSCRSWAPLVGGGDDICS